MVRYSILAFFFFASLLFLTYNGCAYVGPQYPTVYGPTVTPTSTP